MKYVKNIGVPILFLCFYFLFGILLQLFVKDVVVATLVTDLVVGTFALIYYKKQFTVDVNLNIAKYMLFEFFVCMLAMQIVLKNTTVWFNTVIENSASNDSGSIEFIGLLLVLVFAPFAEEILMRGVWFNSLKQIIPVGLAYIISSVVFAAMHGTIIHIFTSFVTGLFFNMLYNYTGKLRYSIIAHSLCNLLSFFSDNFVLSDVQSYYILFLLPFNLLIFGSLIVLYINMHDSNKNQNIEQSEASDGISDDSFTCKNRNTMLTVDDILCYLHDMTAIRILQADSMDIIFDGIVYDLQHMKPDDIRKRNIVSDNGLSLDINEQDSMLEYPYLCIVVK